MVTRSVELVGAVLEGHLFLPWRLTIILRSLSLLLGGRCTLSQPLYAREPRRVVSARALASVAFRKGNLPALVEVLEECFLADLGEFLLRDGEGGLIKRVFGFAESMFVVEVLQRLIIYYFFLQFLRRRLYDFQSLGFQLQPVLSFLVGFHLPLEQFCGLHQFLLRLGELFVFALRYFY